MQPCNQGSLLESFHEGVPDVCLDPFLFHEALQRWAPATIGNPCCLRLITINNRCGKSLGPNWLKLEPAVCSKVKKRRSNRGVSLWKTPTTKMEKASFKDHA